MTTAEDEYERGLADIIAALDDVVARLKALPAATSHVEAEERTRNLAHILERVMEARMLAYQGRERHRELRENG